MKKYKRYSRAKIIGILNSWKASQLTKRQFCRNENISHSTFANWHKKYSQDLDQPSESDNVPAFIPIKLEDQTPSRKSGYSPIEVSFPNGVHLQDVTAEVIPATVYPNTFRRKLIDFAVKITSRARNIVMNVTKNIYQTINIEFLWKRCQSPPQIHLT